MSVRDEFRAALAALLLNDSSFFGPPTANNATAEAVITLLGAELWNEALRDFQIEIAEGGLGWSPEGGRVLMQDLLGRKLSGRRRVELLAAAGALLESSQALLGLWHQSAPGSDAPRPLSSADALAFAEKAIEAFLFAMRRLVDAVGAGVPVGGLTAAFRAAAAPQAPSAPEEALGVSPGLSAVTIAVDGWAYATLNGGLVDQAPRGSRSFRVMNPLDTRTGPVCRALAGSRIPASEVATFRYAAPVFLKIGQRPRSLPPWHPYCRSYLVPEAYYLRSP